MSISKNDKMHAPKKAVCVKSFQVSNEGIKSTKVWYEVIYIVGNLVAKEIIL